MEIITLVDGKEAVLDVAETMHEAGIWMGRRREMFKGKEVSFLIDGKEHKTPEFMTDVKAVAKNMKTRWIENKIMGDMNI